MIFQVLNHETEFKHPKNTCVYTNTKWQSILILDPIIQAENQNEPQIMKADIFKGD